MIITWLKGKTRIKGASYTREIDGYRCSGCNHFAIKKMRKCPDCKGDYHGQIAGEDNEISSSI